MPGRNGKGPVGQGAGFGRGNAGPDGECVCPHCGHRIFHQRGVPCNTVKCSQCGNQMTRG